MPAHCLLGSSKNACVLSARFIHMVIISLVYLLLSSLHTFYFMLHRYLTTTFLIIFLSQMKTVIFYYCCNLGLECPWTAFVSKLLLPGVGLQGACCKWKAGDTEMLTSLLLPCCHGNQAFFILILLGWLERQFWALYISPQFHRTGIVYLSCKGP